MHQHVYGHEAQAEAPSFACQHEPYAGSKVAVDRENDSHVTVLYGGLWDGERAPTKTLEIARAGKQWTFPADTFELELRVDPSTEDLIINPTARSEYPGLCGVAISLANISDEVRLLRPMYCGAEILGPEHPRRCEGLRWPSQWAAALVIGISPRGTFAVWAQDAQAVTKHLISYVSFGLLAT